MTRGIIDASPISRGAPGGRRPPQQAVPDIEFCGRAIERAAATRPRRIRRGSKTACGAASETPGFSLAKTWTIRMDQSWLISGRPRNGLPSPQRSGKRVFDGGCMAPYNAGI